MRESFWQLANRNEGRSGGSTTLVLAKASMSYILVLVSQVVCVRVFNISPIKAQNGQIFANLPKLRMERSFLQHESKIEDILRFFPINSSYTDEL